MSSVSNRIGLLQKTQSCVHIRPGRPLALWGTDLCTHSLTEGFHLQDVRCNICYMSAFKERVFMCIRRKKGKKKSKLRFGPEDENVGLQEKTVKGYTDFTIKWTRKIPTTNTHPEGKKQCCRTLLAYILIVAVNGTLWDYSKIPSGMLHVIHWIFFCLFPTKRFHREKTMMSSSSPLCWERIIARFCWLEHFSQWHL